MILLFFIKSWEAEAKNWNFVYSWHPELFLSLVKKKNCREITDAPFTNKNKTNKYALALLAHGQQRQSCQLIKDDRKCLKCRNLGYFSGLLE